MELSVQACQNELGYVGNSDFVQVVAWKKVAVVSDVL